MEVYLPFKFKKPGLIISVLSILMLLLSWIFWKYENDFYMTLKVCGRLFLAVGLFFFSMSLEKQEDEIIDKIRLQSFFISLAVITSLVILNESFYFFTNQYEIKAIDLLIFLLAVKSVIFFWKLKRLG